MIQCYEEQVYIHSMALEDRHILFHGSDERPLSVGRWKARPNVLLVSPPDSRTIFPRDS